MIFRSNFRLLGWSIFIVGVDQISKLIVSHYMYPSESIKILGDFLRLTFVKNPGMAFGTGGHSTTLLCLELLEDAVKGGERVADIGTGSGILAIAAIKLGAGEVTAVDVDQTAVEVARNNVQMNHVEDGISLVSGELLNGLTGKYDVLVSNISKQACLSIIPDAKSYLMAGGAIILSGILSSEVGEVKSLLEASSLEIEETRYDEEWGAIIARMTP